MNNLIKKGLVIGIICLLMLVSVPTVVSENGKPDLRILELAINYENILSFEAYKKVIKCKVKNIGNASINHIGIQGTAERLFFKVGGGYVFVSTLLSLAPGEECWISTIEFPAMIFNFQLFYNGFFNVYINISVPNDLNSSDNIVEGKFIILRNIIKPL